MTETKWPNGTAANPNAGGLRPLPPFEESDALLGEYMDAHLDAENDPLGAFRDQVETALVAAQDGATYAKAATTFDNLVSQINHDLADEVITGDEADRLRDAARWLLEAMPEVAQAEPIEGPSDCENCGATPDVLPEWHEHAEEWLCLECAAKWTPDEDTETAEAFLEWDGDADEPGERDETMRRDRAMDVEGITIDELRDKLAARDAARVLPITLTATPKVVKIPSDHEKLIEISLVMDNRGNRAAVKRLMDLEDAELVVTLTRRQPVFGEHNGWTPVDPGPSTEVHLNGSGVVLTPADEERAADIADWAQEAGQPQPTDAAFVEAEAANAEVEA